MKTFFLKNDPKAKGGVALRFRSHPPLALRPLPLSSLFFFPPPLLPPPASVFGAGQCGAGETERAERMGSGPACCKLASGWAVPFGESQIGSSMEPSYCFSSGPDRSRMARSNPALRRFASGSSDEPSVLNPNRELNGTLLLRFHVYNT